ncbi:cupin domain-containing protein [Glycomyces arizonensis]|uniref:cupin domain-containing protein n=1 Tax=Glycomyces arizonensis TaxID=256035 RepID=UPI0003FCFB52|nr:cupin domain-containing protein [Glycomyces arizonensis]
MSDDRLERYSKSIAGDGLVPLWDRFGDLVRPRPAGQAGAHIWRYAEARESLMLAGEVISVEQAERRVLILENPALPGTSSITRSLYAGLQLLRPGEVAPAHRHTQSALRLILEGESSYSTVNGDKTAMGVGDVVVTPPWSWHDHGNDGDAAEDTVWLDALDIPTVSFYDASFLENLPAASQPSEPDGRAGLWAAGLRPTDRRPEANPLTAYPYVETLKRLEQFAAQTDPHPVRGWEAEYIDPATGGPILTTMSAFLSILPEGPSAGTYRSTDATVLVPLEGSGTTTVGGQTIGWKPRDVVVIPSWAPYSHDVDDGSAVVFSYSDRAAQTALGLWREETEADAAPRNRGA